MQQSPQPGQHVLCFSGDTVTFTLTLPDAPNLQHGRAFLRTNIGHGETTRREIVRDMRERQARLAEDWFDVPMTPHATGSTDSLLRQGYGGQAPQTGGGRQFRLTLPLCEVGHFEAKAYFLPDNSDTPLWPEGPNTAVNVHPPEYCCANTLYNAFVRQFGANKEHRKNVSAAQHKALESLDAEGYTVIPPSGTFRDVIRELDFIVRRLRCRILMLLPIHPTPTVYARMDRYGSPYAALDFFDVDPALAEFDKRRTPMEQFQELLDAVHAREARLFLDIANHHTGWAAKLHSLHPEWLVREPDGTIRSPGAWGVTWEDLTELDFRHRELWFYMTDLFLAWCRRGVDGFRCDAGYMIPFPVWEFIIARVRQEFPAAIFLLEGLGGRIEVTTDLLNRANVNWAYSELFQNYDRAQIETYLPFSSAVSASDGLMMHFAETHDNTRLAARSIPYARMRTAMSALFSSCGAFAFANGVEWFAREKIAVHDNRTLHWNNKVNQVADLERLNTLLSIHPAFFPGAETRFIHRGPAQTLALLRHHPASGKRLLVLVNLDDQKAGAVAWNPADAGFPAGEWSDLLGAHTVRPEPACGESGVPSASSSSSTSSSTVRLTLKPGEVLCLSADPADLAALDSAVGAPAGVPDRVRRQCLRSKALEILQYYRGSADCAQLKVDELADALAADPAVFCRRQNPDHDEDMTVVWNWPRDLKRQVMIPPGHFLLVKAEAPFRAMIEDDSTVIRHENSVTDAEGRHFALILPPPAPSDFLPCTLQLSVYSAPAAAHESAPLLFLPRAGDAAVPLSFERRAFLSALGEIRQPTDGGERLLVLGTNGRGGMMRAAAAWGELYSRYDALLAANLNTEVPEDRRIMFTRCRAWLVYKGFSQEITLARLLEFRATGPSSALWKFRVPFGHGQTTLLHIRLEMPENRNAVRLSFFREATGDQPGCLGDEHEVKLILRPDIEDRGFHETTKAFAGPEKHWPGAAAPADRGFTFAPDPARRLRLTVSDGAFRHEPEWQYMVHRPVEAERGLDAASDLFSPGYFHVRLKGGAHVELLACILTDREPDDLSFGDGETDPACGGASTAPLSAVLKTAMRHFIVRRNDLKTVIAGYPWFLDWGRDTLIAARGLIAAGWLDEVKAILLQFAHFEKDGTLPNMIRGEDARNRDTSDAPLWFFTACADLCAREGHMKFLETTCGKRPLIQVLESIAQSLLRGTSNGIKMDGDSGLIYSPSHFTWMDTNHPAGSPRQGYPIEIQALWYAAVKFLAESGSTRHSWNELAGLVKDSIRRLYYQPARGFFSDCLHAHPDQPAAKAAPDDALRPNQLLALTLGAVEEADIRRSVLSACKELLIPGAIRTLANRFVEFPLPIVAHGHTLNDPHHPYWGRYEGPENERRKPAYHNGTAWVWVFPSFCEAWVQTYGAAGKASALAWLSSTAWIVNRGCLGQLPEILDGDAPHRPRGCDAQAWSATETYRVLALLQ